MSKISSETVVNQGRQYHIGCAPGDLAEYILLVGDPGRVQRVAQNFDSVRFENQHREFFSATGNYQGLELSVLSTGAGQGSTEVAVIEACQVTKNPTFIRCGSTGSIQPEPQLGDLIISSGSVRLDNTMSCYVDEGYPALASTDVVLALGLACKQTQARFHVGLTASAPGFYGAQGREVPGFSLKNPGLPEKLAKMNIMNFEMESATIFVLSLLRGVRAGAICAVFANRRGDEFADQKMREAAEKKCIETSLKAFLNLKKMDAEREKQGTPIWLPK